MYWTLKRTWFEAVRGLQFFTMWQRYILVVRQHSLTAEPASAEPALAEPALAVAERAVKKALLFGFGIVYCLYDIIFTRSPA